MSHALWNEMASHFEDPYEVWTFGPHWPYSFFEVFYQYPHGDFLRHAGRLRCLRLISFLHRRSALAYDGHPETRLGY